MVGGAVVVDTGQGLAVPFKLMNNGPTREAGCNGTKHFLSLRRRMCTTCHGHPPYPQATRTRSARSRTACCCRCCAPTCMPSWHVPRERLSPTTARVQCCSRARRGQVSWAAFAVTFGGRLTGKPRSVVGLVVVAELLYRQLSTRAGMLRVCRVLWGDVLGRRKLCASCIYLQDWCPNTRCRASTVLCFAGVRHCCLVVTFCLSVDGMTACALLRA